MEVSRLVLRQLEKNGFIYVTKCFPCSYSNYIKYNCKLREMFLPYVANKG